MRKNQLPDEEFEKRMERSHWAARRVETFLKSKGMDVELLPMKIRPTFEERFQYSDKADMIWHRKGGDCRIEVKHRPDLRFTCAADYKFPTLFVDTVASFERERELPLGFYTIVNADATVFAYVPPKTQSKWKKIKTFDSATKQKTWFYEIPVAEVPKWVKMSQ